MAKARRWTRLLNTLQISRDYSKVPAGLSWRSNTFFILSTIAMGLFSDLFMYGLVVPVLPFVLQDRIGVPPDLLQSHVSALIAAYALAAMLCSPVAGYLADRVRTRQAPFLIGLLTLLGATVMLFTGQSLWVLYVARALQGTSAAIVWTVGLALCLETVGSDKFGTTIGSIFSFVGTGTITAPLLGGVLYEKVGLNGVFAIGCAVIAVDLVMRILVIEKKVASTYKTDGSEPDHGTRPNGQEDHQNDATRPQSRPEADGERQPLLGIKPDDDNDFKISDNLPSIARKIPILPCLLDPRLATAFLLGLVQALVYGAFDATVPIVAQELFGFDSLKAGLLFLAPGAVDLFLGPFFGWCVDRYGTKPVAVLAYGFLVPAHILLRLPHAGGGDQIALYVVLLALGGVGIAGINAPSIVEAGAVIERYHRANPGFFGERGPYAQLYGFNTMMFNLGLTIGPELAGELKTAIGYGNMNAVLAGICAVTCLLSIIYMGGKLTWRPSQA